MFGLLAKIYSRRIVNVNVNIVLAGFIALGPTLLVVRLMEHLLASGFHPGQRLHLSDSAIITGVTFISDLFFDVSIYYLLHWLANHSGKRKRQVQLETIADAAAENVPFFRDATKVQIQRLVLSPLLYLIFLGGQFTLMTWYGVRPVFATIICFTAGIAAARALHTLWMLREQRARRLAAIRSQRAAHTAAARLAADGVDAADRVCRDAAASPSVISRGKVDPPPGAVSTPATRA